MADWTEITVETSTAAVEAVSYQLTNHGATGVKIDDAADFAKLTVGKYGKYGEIVDPFDLPHRESGAAVTGYFPPTTFVPEVVAEVEAAVKQLTEFGIDPAPAKVSVNQIINDDWALAWQKYYHPVRITHQLTVVPAWVDYQPSDQNEKQIVLDPGMAFGTGTHPTTKLMLQALEMTIRGGESLLDVGTGSGVLSIAAKQLGAGKVQAYDLDPVAVESAKKNLALNPVANDVLVGQNSLLDGIKTQVDMVVANILAEIILPLIPQAMANLKPSGKFLTSGIIKDKFEEILTAQEKASFVIDETMRIKDWYGIIAHKKGEDD